MSIEKIPLEHISESQEKVTQLRVYLDAEADKALANDCPEHFINIIKAIADAFRRGVESDDILVVKDAYEEMRIHDNYFSAKYRDSASEYVYVQKVAEAMALLATKAGIEI